MKEILRVNFVGGKSLRAAQNPLKVQQVRSRGKNFVVVRFESKIVGYEYLNDKGEFEFKWTKPVGVDGALHSYPLWSFDLNSDGSDEAIIRERDGLMIYSTSADNKLLGRDHLFKDFYAKDLPLLIGKFYANPRSVGVMRRDNQFNVGFRVFKNNCLDKPGCAVLQTLTKKLDLSDVWRDPGTRFHLTNLRRSAAQELFALRTQTGLEFYEFNADYTIRKTFEDSSMEKLLGKPSRDERLFFADITSQPYQDVAHLNSSGLFLYHYDDVLADYALLNYATEFSSASGWTFSNYETMQFADLNGDDSADVIFTGLDGIAAKSFDMDARKWETLELQGLGMEKFSKIIGLVNVDEGPVVFVQSTSGELKHSKLKPEVIEEPKTPRQPLRPSKKGKMLEGASSLVEMSQIPKAPIAPSSELRWTEQFASEFEGGILKTVPTGDGFTAFSLPLMDATLSQYLKIQLALFYHDHMQDSQVAGIGWNMSLTSNHIAVDYRCSVFEDDAVYSFFGLGKQMILKREISLEVEGTNVMRFSVPGQKDMKVSFHNRGDSNWVIETATERFVYGKDRSFGATQMNLSWKNFRCGGSNISSLERVPVAWFLRERRDLSVNKSIYYRYNVVEAPIVPGGKLYTRSVSLSKINDGKKNLVSFDYVTKADEEIADMNLINNGKVTFPIPLSDDFCLTKISLQIESFVQSFEFKYRLDGADRFLTSVEQTFEENANEQIIAMDYEKVGEQFVMNFLNLPRGSQVILNHAEQYKQSGKNAFIWKFPTNDKPSIVQADGYKVVAFKRENKINLRIHDDTDKDFVFVFSVGDFTFDFQVIPATRSMFTIVTMTENRKQIFVFAKNGKSWSNEAKQKFTFAGDDVLHFGEKFIAISHPSKASIQVLQWEDSSKELSMANVQAPNNRPLLAVASYNRILVGYDDLHLMVFNMNTKSQWKVRNVKKLSDYHKTTIETVKKFDVSQELQKQLIDLIAPQLMQMNGNEIVLTQIRESGGTLMLTANMMLLDSDFEVKEQIETICSEKIFDLSKDELINEGKLSLKYAAVGGKFTAQVHLTAPGEDSRLLTSREVPDFDPQKVFLPDWSKYSVQLNALGLFSNDTKFTMSGARWEKSVNMPGELKTFSFGPKLIFEETNAVKNEWKLFETRNMQKKFVKEIKVEGKFEVVYPHYIAYQSTATDIEVISFNFDQTVESTKTIPNEQLIQADKNFITTLASATTIAHVETHEIRLHPTLDFIKKIPISVVSRVTLKSDGLARVTSFERSSEVDEQGKLIEKLFTIPGGKKSKFGWREEIRSFNPTSKVITKEENIFYANGGVKSHTQRENEVKSLISDEKKEERVDDNPHKLMDKSKTFVICDLKKQKLSDENFAFLGFETYEGDNIGGDKGRNAWRYEKANVIHKGFSLTGESFLRLTESHGTLQGNFKPADQDGFFAASCWVRVSSGMNLDEQTETLFVTLSTNGRKITEIPAQVKRKVGDWNYLEALVDLKNIRTTNRINLRDEIDVELSVMNEEASAIDVDHIRFSPIAQNTHVDVYNEAGQVTSTILSNGAIKRKLYNKYKREIANIDENGKLVDLKSLSVTGRMVSSTDDQNRPSMLLLRPSENVIYDPIEWWKEWKISGANKKDSWTVSSGQLRHKGRSSHQIVIPGSKLNMSSNVIRFDYAMSSNEASINIVAEGKSIAKLSGSKLAVGLQTFQIPSTGEVIFMIEGSRFGVWIDSVLVAESGSSPKFNDGDSLTLEVAGSVALEHFVTINNPTVTIEYFNSWGEPTQIINVETEKTAQVTQTLRDGLGRNTITTKATRISASPAQTLLSFRENFVTNENYADRTSVWFTQQLEGEVDDLNPKCAGYAYKQTRFEKSPTNDQEAIGLPGKDYSVIGPYSKKIENKTDLPFLLNLFPAKDGFTMQTTINENGSKKVKVLDKFSRRVAVYVRVPGFDHIFSINEFDSEGRIVKILPPAYHERAGTFTKTDPWRFGDSNLTREEKSLQALYGTTYAYDKQGNLIRKSTPDAGVVKYIYDKNDNRRFMKMADGKVVYFLYDESELLIETGSLEGTHKTKALKSLALQRELPSTIKRNILQEINYSNEAEDPEERRASKKFVTHNGDEEVHDGITFDINNMITTKQSTSMNGPAMNIERTYAMNKLETLTYPKEFADEEDLTLVFKYDKRGLLNAIGTHSDPTKFAEFKRAADGQLVAETILPNSDHQYVRSFDYATAGYLEHISDPFLTEDITYTANGYGQKGFGDGVISSTTFQATWADSADPKNFKINEEGKFKFKHCMKPLRDAGCITPNEVVIKAMSSNDAMPLDCRERAGRELAKLVAQKQIPRFYGHRFAYGNHQELTKAKYFSDKASMEAEPLQPDKFAKEISGVTEEESLEIWQILVDSRFISVVQRGDIAFATGNQGQVSLVKLDEIEEVLSSLASPTFDASKVVPGIATMMLNWVLKKEFPTIDSFQMEYLAMFGFTEDVTDWQVEHLKQQSDDVFEALSAKNLLPKYPKLYLPLNPQLNAALKPKFFKEIPAILAVLNANWSENIGELPFDLYSHDIDSNGNHRSFYNGYERFKLEYHETTNKIKNVRLDDITTAEPRKNFAFDHDENGSVTKAHHLDIDHIEYYATSQRTKKIFMTDGRSLEFFYDVVGERILKQVFSARGELLTSTKYVRDENGLVMVDQKTNYHPKPQPPQMIVTKYIYGPRGLLGFIRNGSFFSVATDHAGSTRLIIKDGEVVASYDYLPYGKLMRKFVNKAEFDISYLFTGQEFDEETGLYNYHARLYDPAIGRFYQIDPQAQYFSPYLYAGNSPISFVDPDGEFVFILGILIGVAIGAYIGGGVTNDSLNPTKWDWKSRNTYLGVAGGALVGGIGGAVLAAYLPGAVVFTGKVLLASAGVVPVTAYIGGVAHNRNFNIFEWKNDEGTLNAVLAGGKIGFTLVLAIAAPFTVAKLTPLMAKGIAIALAAGAVRGGVYGAVGANGGNWKVWEWKGDRANIAKTFGSFLEGTPQGLNEVRKFINALTQFDNVKIGTLEDKTDEFTGQFVYTEDGETHNIRNIEIQLARLTKVLDQSIKEGRYDSDLGVQNIKYGENSNFEGTFNNMVKSREPVELGVEVKEFLKKKKQKAPQNIPEESDDYEDLNREKRSLSHHQTVPLLTDHSLELFGRFNVPTLDVLGPQMEAAHSSTTSTLEFGDMWLNQTEAVGNLTLLSLLVDKLFRSNKTKLQRSQSSLGRSNIEYQLVTSNVVNDFIENFLGSTNVSDSALNEIIENHIDTSTINRKVEREIRRKDYGKVLTILKQEIVLKNFKNFENHQQKDLLDLASAAGEKTAATLEDFEEQSQSMK